MHSAKLTRIPKDDFMKSWTVTQVWLLPSCRCFIMISKVNFTALCFLFMLNVCFVQHVSIRKCKYLYHFTKHSCVLIRRLSKYCLEDLECAYHYILRYALIIAFLSLDLLMYDILYMFTTSGMIQLLQMTSISKTFFIHISWLYVLFFRDAAGCNIRVFAEVCISYHPSS